MNTNWRRECGCIEAIKAGFSKGELWKFLLNNASDICIFSLKSILICGIRFQ